MDAMPGHTGKDEILPYIGKGMMDGSNCLQGLTKRSYRFGTHRGYDTLTVRHFGSRCIRIEYERFRAVTFLWKYSHLFDPL